MASRWALSYSAEATQQLHKMDRPTAQRLIKYLEERVIALDDPRKMGKALRGSKWGDCWRYRCGDYRIVVRLLDDDVVVMVMRVGHRKNVYV
jgi:mRNA interferase RelE/StbE